MILCSFFLTASGSAQGLIKILINNELYPKITPEVLQYSADLEAEGYRVSILAGSWSSPQAIRGVLQTERANGLIGAVLIGKLPLARFNLSQDLQDPFWHSFETPLYYMDLDGSWGGVQQGVFTLHSGNREPEIWLGIVRADSLPAAGPEDLLIRNYLQKVHAYRVGSHFFPKFRAFQLYQVKVPTYAHLGAIYSDVREEGCDSATATTLRGLLKSHRGYDFGVINSAAGARVQHLHALPPNVPATYWDEYHDGEDIDYRDVQKINPKILFYHLAMDEAARLDVANSLAGMYVFGNDFGLGALASTQRAIIGDTFYDNLAAGRTFGESFQEDYRHFVNVVRKNANESTVWCPAWDPQTGPQKQSERFYSAVYIGDPTLRIKVDNRADEVPPIISNVRATDIATDSATVRWDTDEPADSQVEYGATVSYGTASPIQTAFVRQHAVTLRGLSMNTTYHYRVLSRDEAGNIAVNQDYVFTTQAESIPPIISQIRIGALTAHTAEIFWQTDEPADGQIEFGTTEAYGELSALEGELAVDHRLVVSGLLPTRQYHFRIRSRDAFKNLAVSRDSSFTTPVDLVAPGIEQIAVEQISATGANILWQTDEPANSQVEYGLTPAYGELSPVAAAYVVSHAVMLSNLRPATTYHFRVRSSDPSQNLAIGPDNTFKTVADITAPVIRQVAVIERTMSSATITWETDEPATSQVEYGPTNIYGLSTPLDRNLVTSHRVTLSGLTPNTIYYFRVRSEDAYQNGAASSEQTFNTTPDNAAPLLKNISVDSITAVSAVVSWESSELARGQVEYGPSLSYGQTTALGLSPGKNQRIVLEGLSANATYHFRAKSIDAYGNAGLSEDRFFMTPQQNVTFQTTVQIETMVSKSGGQPAEGGTAWQLFPGNSVAQEVDFPGDEVYLFAVRLRQNDNARIALIDFRLDGVSQAQFEASAETYGIFNVRSFVGRGRHTVSLVFISRLNAPPAIFADWLQISSTSGNGPNALAVIDLTVRDISDDGATLEWLTNVAAISAVDFGPETNYRYQLQDPQPRTRHRFVLTGLADTTIFYYQVRSQSATGGQAVAKQGSFTTLFDRFPPAISKLEINSVMANRAVVSWQANEPSRGRVAYGPDLNFTLSTEPDAVLSLDHVDTLRNLMPNTLYHLRVETEDRRGNKGMSPSEVIKTTNDDSQQGFLVYFEAEDMRIKTGGDPGESGSTWRLGGAGFLADSINFPATAEYAFDVRARGTWADGAWPIMELRLNGSAFTRTAVNAGVFETYRAQLSALRGLNQIAILLANPQPDGANSRAVEIDWVRISGEGLAADQQAPVITDIQVLNITANSATIAWRTNELADGEVVYGTSVGLGEYSQHTTTATQVHILVLTGLLPDQNYFYRVQARDAAGNLAIGPLLAFHTAPATSPVEEAAGDNSIPAQFSLSNNYPNPVVSATEIRVELPEPGELRATIYDITGREAARLYEGPISPGVLRLRWELQVKGGAAALHSGIYLLRASFAGRSGRRLEKIQRLVVLR